MPVRFNKRKFKEVVQATFQGKIRNIEPIFKALSYIIRTSFEDFGYGGLSFEKFYAHIGYFKHLTELVNSHANVPKIIGFTRVNSKNGFKWKAQIAVEKKQV